MRFYFLSILCFWISTLMSLFWSGFWWMVPINIAGVVWVCWQLEGHAQGTSQPCDENNRRSC